MGVGGEGMHPPHTQKGRRRHRWKDRGCTVERDREWDGHLDLLPGDVPKKCHQRAAELGAWSPRPSHVVVTSQLPIGQIPWGLPRQMASLPHPARAYPAPAPGVYQLSFAWRS